MAYLRWEDYVILVVTLVLSLGTGLFQSLRGKKDKTTAKYIMGNGKMAVLPVALSLLVSYQSGITMLGLPVEVYLYGMQIFMSFFGNILCDLINMCVFVPHLSRLKITSIFEYLEIRYNSRGIRLFGTGLSIIFAINYLGAALAMPAVTLKAVIGIDVWMSIVGLMVIVLIYTLIGGFTAVIWTDVLQSILMFGGIFAVLIKGTMDAGGLTKTWQTIYDKGRVNLFVFDLDPTTRHTFTNLVVGSIISHFGSPFSQMTYLRIKATPNVKTSKRMYLLAGFLSLVIRVLAGMCGAIIFAYFYNKGCDPLASKQLDNANQVLVLTYQPSLVTGTRDINTWSLMPAMVLDVFQDTPCLPGLFMAALFCASLSTLSSVLSSIMTVFWVDFVKPYTKPKSEKRGILVNQLSGLVFGVVGIGMALLVSEIEGPVGQIFRTITASFTGALSGIFLLGFIVPWANKSGAIVGGAVSVVLVAWITIGQMTSSGTRKNPTLEPAPIDNCPHYNASSVTLYDTNQMSTALYDVDVTSRPDAAIKEPHGLDILYSLSYRWLEPIGIITVLLIGSVVSRLTKSSDTTVAPELVVPICDLLCRCIPATFRKRIHCGTKHLNLNDDDTAVDVGTSDTSLDQWM